MKYLLILIPFLFICESAHSQKLYTVTINAADKQDTLWSYYYHRERIKETEYTISINESKGEKGSIYFAIQDPYYIQYDAELKIIRDLLRKRRQ